MRPPALLAPPPLDDPTVVVPNAVAAGDATPTEESALLVGEYVLIQAVGQNPLSLEDLAQGFSSFAIDHARSKRPLPLPRAVTDTKPLPTYVVRVWDRGAGKVVIEAQHPDGHRCSLVAVAR